LSKSLQRFDIGNVYAGRVCIALDGTRSRFRSPALHVVDWRSQWDISHAVIVWHLVGFIHEALLEFKLLGIQQDVLLCPVVFIHRLLEDRRQLMIILSLRATLRGDLQVPHGDRLV